MKKIRGFKKFGSGVKRFEEGGDVYSKPLLKASFKEAFREARDAGDKTFEYMGKKYTTDLAEPKKEAKPKMESREETIAREKRLKNEPGLERVEPESYLPVGRGLKLAHAGAKALVNAGAKKAAAKEAEDLAISGAMRSEAAAQAKKEAPDLLQKLKDISGVSARQKAKEAEATAAKKTRAKSSGAMEGEAGAGELRYKSGGKVSSASRRADGCAIRGKTRA